MTDVRLRWSGPLRLVRLGPVTGVAELAVADTGARSAIAFLDALLPVDAASPCARRGEAADLAVADRDRVLAAVYRDIYGDRVDASLVCRDCTHPYDLSFSLGDLVAHCEPTTAELGDPPSTYALGEIEFRPLTGRDELAVLDGDEDRAEGLLRRVVAGPAGGADGIDADLRRRLSEVLDEVAPLLSVPLAGACPECGAAQASQFDIHGFLLGRLQAERASVMNAVHLLASRYHWSRADILGLDRHERETYVSLVTQQTTGRRAAGGPR